jgi:cell wall-associated NlpC family hydrolase
MREEAIAAARACIDTPFRHQGRIAGRALDCGGLGVHVLQSLELPVVDPTAYSRLPSQGQLLAILQSQPALRQVPREQAEPGDILLVRIGREPSHIAVQTGEYSIVHAYQPVGRVIEHGMDQTWRDSIVAAFQIVSQE